MTEVPQGRLPPDDERAFGRVLESVSVSILGREASEAVRVVLRAPRLALEALRELSRGPWMRRWRDGLAGPLGAIAEEAAKQNAGSLISFDLQNPRMGEWLDGYASKLAETLSETSYRTFEGILADALREGLSVEETARRIEGELPEANRRRAELIARNELHVCQTMASELQARESGVVTARTWLSADDDRVRPAHRLLDGVTVGMDEPFPGGAHPATAINCRCTLIFTVDPVLLGGVDAA